jgi:alkylated DNA repair dioxygenase AlkB
MKFFLDNVLEPQLPAILDSLTNIGAASLPILTPECREQLGRIAQNLPYQPQAEKVGKPDRVVRQQLAFCQDFSQATLFIKLRDAFQNLLAQSLAHLDSSLFYFPIDLNSMVLQKYEPGSIGITPHRDGKRYKNLICIFVLEGQGKFYVCRDRAGNNPLEIDASPGNVLLMRAPGFRGIDHSLATTDEIRPFHFITDIQTQRYTFALRQQVN